MKRVNRETHHAIREFELMAESGRGHCPLCRKIEKLKNTIHAELAATTIGSLAREFTGGRTPESGIGGRYVLPMDGLSFFPYANKPVKGLTIIF